MIAASDIDHQVSLAAIALIAPLIGVIIYLAKRTNIAVQQATEANQAVNNVGPGEHSLWDQISFIRDEIRDLREAQQDFHKRGWATLPDDIATASRLTETIRQIQHDQRLMSKDLDALTERLIDHDKWERETKYQG